MTAQLLKAAPTLCQVVARIGLAFLALRHTLVESAQLRAPAMVTGRVLSSRALIIQPAAGQTRCPSVVKRRAKTDRCNYSPLLLYTLLRPKRSVIADHFYTKNSK